MTINIAIIGTGSIAEDQHAPAVQEIEGLQLWSVLSRDLKRGVKFAERYDARAPNPAHTELEALLSDPRLDAVIIATPDKLHAEMAMVAAQAGKHVLVEKPMATDVKSAEAMLKACDEAKVQLAVAYHLRWHAGHRKILEKIRSGELGTLRHMRAHWTWRVSDADNWRAWPELGRWWSLASVGTHCLDLIRWIMLPGCGEIESLKSTLSKKVWEGPHDETAVVSLRFESGATAEFCSSVLFESPSRLEIYGDRGYAICEGTLDRRGAGSIRTHEGTLEYPIENPFVGEIRDFVDSIRDKRPPQVDGREGLRNIQILEAASVDN